MSSSVSSRSSRPGTYMGSSVCLSWKHHERSLSSNAWRLMQDESVVDVDLECEGRVFRVHKLVLAASCLYFRENLAVLSSPGRVSLRLHDDMGMDARHQDLCAAINFMYLGELAVVQDRLQGVMDIAQMLGIYGLQELIMEQAQGKADGRVVTPNPYQEDGLSKPLTPYLFSEDGESCDKEDEEPEKTTISVQTDIDMWNMDSVFQKQRRKGQSEDDEEEYFVSVFDDTDDIEKQNPLVNTVEKEMYARPADTDTLRNDTDEVQQKQGGCDETVQIVEKLTRDIPVKEQEKKTVRKKRKPKKPSELEGLLSKPVAPTELVNRPHLRSAANQERSKVPEPSPPQIKPKQTKDRLIECNACEEQFISRDAFKLHVWRTHKLGSVFKCDLCDHMTPIKSSFMKHLLTHSDTKDFVCRLCGKAFKSRGGLNIHLRSHQGDNCMFKCSHCTFKTLQKFNLVKHLATKHGKDMLGNDLAPSCRCTECDFVCIAEHILKTHMLRKHTVDKRFKCGHCEYATVEKAALDKHVRIRHTNERPYMCEVCGFSSHTISGITRHRRSHTGVKPYKCDQCGQQYADRKRLRDHMLKHANEKPFICEVCGCTFRRKDNLQAHLRKNHRDGGTNPQEEPPPEEEAPPDPTPTIPQVPITYTSQYEDIPPYEEAVTSECGFSATFAPSLIYVNNGTMHMGYYMTSGTVVPQAVTQVVTSAVVPSGAEGQPQHSELILVRASPMVASTQAAPNSEAGL